MTSDAEVFAMKTHGQTIYVFDPSAPPENTQLLPIGHNKLKCSARVLPRKPPKLPKPAPKKDEPPEDDKKRAKVQKEDKSAQPDPPDPLPEPIQCHLREPPESAWRGEAPPPRTVLPMTTVLPRTTILPRAGSPAARAGKGKGNGRGTKNGVEKSLGEKIAEELALAGAIANQQMNEDIHDPKGKRFGIPGGMNPDGPNSPWLQAAAGVVQVVAVLSPAQAFKKKLMDALKKGTPLVLKGTRALSEKTAEELAKRYGRNIAHALAVNETIGEYRVMKKFTANLNGDWQAHHILEEAMARELKLGSRNTDKLPSVLLTKAEHEKITARLKKAAERATRNGERMTPKKLWQVYKRVYKDHPHWLDAIEPYFVGCQ
jgi:hypothetical protein